MNVLNESFDTLANFSLSHSNTGAFLTCDFVAGKRFTEDSDKRAIPREENSVCWLVYISAPRGKIQADQRFTSSGHTRDETNDFAFLDSSFVYQLFDSRRRNAKILRTCIVTCDG